MALVKPISKFSTTPKFSNPRTSSYPRVTTIKMSATAQPTTSKPKKKFSKTEIKESFLTPRFYTTDFDEMETLFNTEINKNLNQAEFEALLQEFKTDYNQTHFVRNKEFKEAADKLQGPLRQIFVEFLERSCTAEFSGFLLYKELGRRLKVWLYGRFQFLAHVKCLLEMVFLYLLMRNSSFSSVVNYFNNCCCRKPILWWQRFSPSCPGMKPGMLGM